MRKKISTEEIINKIFDICKDWVSYPDLSKQIKTNDLKLILDILVYEEYLEKYSSHYTRYYRIKQINYLNKLR